LENTGQKIKLKTTENTQTKHNPEKANNNGLVACYDTLPGNKVSLFYNVPEPMWVPCEM